MSNAINWFEIPAADFERAVRFYETILMRQLHRIDFMGSPQAFFSLEPRVVGGAIVGASYLENHPMVPARDGACVYLNTEGRLAEILGRVEEAGGRVAVPMMPIGPAGFVAVIHDSEGNRVGLHQELS